MKTANVVLFIILAMTLNLSGQELVAESFNTPITSDNVNPPASKGSEKTAGYKWEFLMPEIEKLSGENNTETGSYRLGAENARLRDYITETYTSAEPIAPGNPMTRIVIRKPAIFNAVKTIEKYYFGSLKKKELTQLEAETDFRKVLQVAVAAASEDSKSFEDALQEQRRNASQLIELFNLVKLKQM